MENNDYIKELNELKGYDLDEFREVQEVINIIENMESVVIELSNEYKNDFLRISRCVVIASEIATNALLDSKLMKAKRYAKVYHHFKDRLNELIDDGIPF